MKRKIFTLAAALLSCFGASAQLTPGSVAPDFTLKDLNGNSYTLYSLLQQGKTVYLDLSAAWCGPCWNYQQTGELETLWKQHGPAGGNGVLASTTNDVMVFMLETEPSNTRAQLYGPKNLTGTRANVTQGDWVTGTLYPIIDTDATTTNAITSAWKLSYYPTIYMVCRDRLVKEVGQQTASYLYAQSKMMCPTTGLSSSTDAKPVIYSGKSIYFCNANPTVSFQNYGTAPITSATVNVYAGATKVGSQTWSGNLNSYQTASVSVPTFAGTVFSPYTFEVKVNGDAVAANDRNMWDTTMHVYAAANAVNSPWSQNFEASPSMPYKMATNGNVSLFQQNTDGSYKLMGVDGKLTRGVIIPFFELANNALCELVLGNFNTSAAPNVALDFDVSHYNISGKNDKLDIMVSTDCGTTWSSVWSKSGAALGTSSSNPGSGVPFLPKVGSDWRHESVLLTAKKNANLFIKVSGTGNQGQYVWMDNFRLSNTVNVPTVVANGYVNIYPNPTKDVATLEFSLSKSSNVQINVLDALGRTVANVANGDLQQGDQRFTIPTSALAAGTYTITVRTDGGVITQRLSVVK